MTTKTRLKTPKADKSAKSKVAPVCWFQCGKTIDTYRYARAVVDGVSYAVCGEGCKKWPEGAVYIGHSTPGANFK